MRNIFIRGFVFERLDDFRAIRQYFSPLIPYFAHHMTEPESERVLDLLGDDYARQILAYLTREPMLAEELGEKCDGSESTIYDRLDQLHSMGLVSTTLQIDSKGHHRKQYETILTSVNVIFHDGIYEVKLEIKEDPPDRIARIWGGMRRE